MTSSASIVTSSGRRVFLGAIDPRAIRFSDIAANLARISRYCGSTRLPISVAEHSIIAARIMRDLGGTPLETFFALIHDFHEAYIGDIAAPVADYLFPPCGEASALDTLKHRFDIAIHLAFAIATPDGSQAALVRTADARAFATEWRDLMPDIPCPVPVPPAAFSVATPMGWAKAEDALTREAARLARAIGVRLP